MQAKQILNRLFRLVLVLVVFAMVLTQSVGTAQAQDKKPPSKEKAQVEVNLDEVDNYFHLTKDKVEGPINVVVELGETPAALLYSDTDRSASGRATAQVEVVMAEQASFSAALSNSGIRTTEFYRTQKAYNGIWMQVDAKDVHALASLPGVVAIHPMIPKTIDHTTSVPLIAAPEVWAGLGNYQGDTISIGIIDTGIDYVHTNFGGPGVYTGQDFTTLDEAGNLFPTAKVVGGWDFAGDAYNANDTTPIIAPDPDPMDCYGHGSHVAGSAAGYGVNPDGTTYEFSGRGYSNLNTLTAQEYRDLFRIGPGVAPMAELYSLRVFGCNGSTNLTEQAIEWAMDPNGDNDMSDHLDIINMSLGSAFGSEYDSSAVASDNAAQAGVIVVTSAGNEGDVYYVTGAPGMAKYAISTANTVDSGNVFATAEDTTNAIKYAAVEASFGPAAGSPGITAPLVLVDDGTGVITDGCETLVNNLTNSIALVDRGSCSFEQKAMNAEAAGAVGVLIVNNLAGYPVGMADGIPGSDPTIPTMMIGQADGNYLKTILPINMRLSSDVLVVVDPSIEDTVASSSSRGPARNSTRLKPDLAAPGTSIFSVDVLTGDKGVSFSGTSMASPHVAGMMALLRQEHPTWSVAELKALAMNTATNDLYTGTNHSGLTYTPTRVGTGRVSAANASMSDVVAYYKDDPGQVSVAFGVVKVTNTQTLTKSITVSNKSGTTQTYDVSLDERYDTNAGVVFSLGATSVTVPANGTVNVTLNVDLDPALMERSWDLTTSGSYRQRIHESGGYVTFTSTGSEPELRVPFHISARPAAAMSTGQTEIDLPAATTGTFSLTPTGTTVNTADDAARVTIMELMAESPNDAWSTGAADNADLQYVGVTSDYPFYGFNSSDLFFGFSTYGDWDTANAVEFDVYLDVDEDGVEDYVVFNINYAAFFGSIDDQMVTAYCEIGGSCNFWYGQNYWGGSTNTNLYNNNVTFLMVPSIFVGLSDGVNSDFNFYVVTYSRDFDGYVDITDWMSYDLENQAFTTTEGVYTGVATWYDIPGLYPTFDIGYNKAAMAAQGGSKGLLLLHHHNATNTAEVLPLALPTVTSITRNDSSPTGAAKVHYTVKFSDAVTGVDTSDFKLTTTATGSIFNGAGITSVSGSGNTYTVTVNTGTGSGSGTLRLDVKSSGTGIMDDAKNPLNGGFTSGEVYTVERLRTFVRRSVGAQDGYIVERRNSGNGALAFASGPLLVGDHKDSTQYRSILSFYTAGLPDNAVITGVTLKLKRYSSLINNPFALGKLNVEIKNGVFGGQALLRPTDFQAGASAIAGEISKKPSGLIYTGEMNSKSYQYVNLTGYTQFRLRFSKKTDGDNLFDLIRFFSGDKANAMADRPQLIIKYYLP